MASEFLNGNGEIVADGSRNRNSDSEEEMANGGDGAGDHVMMNGIKTPSKNHVFLSERIKMKAKRPSQQINKEANGNPALLTNGSTANNTRLLKNSRKPRNGYGRGLPKKGGAGGKGTWGRPGSELYVEEEDMTGDVRDPNYDSESQDNIQLEKITPELTDEELEKLVEPIILEYFEHSDTSEVALCLEEHNIGSKNYQVVVIAIMLAMDRKPSHRELTSVLISDLYMRFLTEADIAKGYDHLLNNLPDIVLDTPEAPSILANFLARSIADDCLPPKFVHSYKGRVECEFARTCLERASILLNMKHGLVRLDNVWGVGGGTRPVKYLIKKMVLLLKEFLSSGDVTEATRCLLDLEVPHFHHELVYEAVVMVIEDMGDRAADLMCKLLKSLYASIIITPDQMKRGFLRVFHAMPDISIDVPTAYISLEKLVTKSEESGFLTDEIVKKMPSRGRKRFVSEGDGGRIKEDSSIY